MKIAKVHGGFTQPSKLNLSMITTSLQVLVSMYCLYIYYEFTEITEKEFMHFGYIAYAVLAANSIMALTSFVNEEAFADLRYLLDYAQLVLVLPCLTSDIWAKYQVAAYEVCYGNVAFAFTAFLFFIVMEYRRQDLTDLAVITSIVSLTTVDILYGNYFAAAAALAFAAAYFGGKRQETCSIKYTEMSSLLMAAVALLSLAAFEPTQWIPNFGTE